MKYFENASKEPNYYQILQLSRSTTFNEIKTNYKKLSLQHHPDKSRNPASTQIFQQITSAYEVLSNREKRQIYDKLGAKGVEIAAQSVLDTKVLLTQIILHYGIAFMITFLLTLSEKSNIAFKLSLTALAGLLILEISLVVLDDKLAPDGRVSQRVTSMHLPKWLLPSYTPHDILALLHQIYPSFMHGCRAIISSLGNVEPLDDTFEHLSDLSHLQTVSNQRVSTLIQKAIPFLPWVEQEHLCQPEGILQRELRVFTDRSKVYSKSASADNSIKSHTSSTKPSSSVSLWWSSCLSVFAYLEHGRFGWLLSLMLYFLIRKLIFSNDSDCK